MLTESVLNTDDLPRSIADSYSEIQWPLMLAAEVAKPGVYHSEWAIRLYQATRKSLIRDAKRLVFYA